MKLTRSGGPEARSENLGEFEQLVMFAVLRLDDDASVAIAVVAGVGTGLAAMLLPRIAIGTAPTALLQSARGSAGSEE